MNDFKQFVPDVKWELIPIKNLVSNQDYQRNLSESHIKKAVENFDLYQINPIKVSRRNGINYVFNGQHTIEIIAKKSGSRETPVWSMVFEDLEYAHEADIFANQQKYVKPLTPYEIFIANIEAGNDEQILIKSVVESYNMVLSPKKTTGAICAVSTPEYIYRRFGYHTLDDTLRLCIATWEGDVNSFSSNILKGVAKIIVAFGSDIDEEIFKEKLGRCSIKEIVRGATERRNGSLGFAEAMLSIYNRRQRVPLHISKLYNKKKINEPDFMNKKEDCTESDYFQE